MRDDGACSRRLLEEGYLDRAQLCGWLVMSREPHRVVRQGLRGSHRNKGGGAGRLAGWHEGSERVWTAGDSDLRRAEGKLRAGRIS